MRVRARVCVCVLVVAVVGYEKDGLSACCVTCICTSSPVTSVTHALFFCFPLATQFLFVARVPGLQLQWQENSILITGAISVRVVRPLWGVRPGTRRGCHSALPSLDG